MGYESMRPRGVTGAEPDHAPDTDLKRIHHALGFLPSSGCDIPRLPCHRRGLCTHRSSDPRRVGVPEAARQDVGQDVGHVEEGHVEDVSMLRMFPSWKFSYSRSALNSRAGRVVAKWGDGWNERQWMG